MDQHFFIEVQLEIKSLELRFLRGKIYANVE